MPNSHAASQVQTSISKQFFSRVCGLCGDYNGEPKNEFLTPEGKLIVDVQKPKLIDEKLKAYQGALFGSSWIVPGRRCVREGVYACVAVVAVELSNLMLRCCM